MQPKKQSLGLVERLLLLSLVFGSVIGNSFGNKHLCIYQSARDTIGKAFMQHVAATNMGLFDYEAISQGDVSSIGKNPSSAVSYIPANMKNATNMGLFDYEAISQGDVSSIGKNPSSAVSYSPANMKNIDNNRKPEIFCDR